MKRFTAYYRFNNQPTNILSNLHRPNCCGKTKFQKFAYCDTCVDPIKLKTVKLQKNDFSILSLRACLFPNMKNTYTS